MRDPQFTRKDGMLTRYAFACGYVQAFTFHPSQSFYGSDDDAVALSLPSPGGVVWDVRSRIGGESTWETFDTYAEALSQWRAYRRLIRARARAATAAANAA